MALAAAWHVATHEMLAFTACALAVSILDDVVVDLLFVGLGAGRRIGTTPLPVAALDRGWMAIIIPAWDEAGVIGAMLRHLLHRLDYPRYRVFVGVYPNDPATRACVEQVADPRIKVVLCARPGPTTKAD